MSKTFWRWSVKDAAENEPQLRELFIEGAIAEESWFDDDVTPDIFRNELLSGSGNVKVHISSPGGDCVAASRIYTMLREYNGNVTVQIDGLAASAASVIAMAGDTVTISPTGIIMIHDPLTFAYGNKNDLKEAIRVLEEFKESILNAYQNKTGLSRDKLSRLMEGEGTWMNARKALELGFVDSILFEDGETVNDTGYSFSAAAACNSLVRKIAAKAETKKTENTADLAGRKRLLELYKEV